MKIFNTIFIGGFALLVLCSCGKEVNLKAEPPKWDIQTCDRCRMLISDKKFSAQIINSQDGKHYFFDDLGCALLWLEGPEAKNWEDKAVIYATDPKDGNWLNIKDSQLVSGYVTPMAYGIGVIPKSEAIPDGKKGITLAEAMAQIQLIKQQKASSKMPHNH